MSISVLPSIVKKNVSLQPFNSFGFEARAAFFSIANQLSELKLLLEWANSNEIEITMLGEGSNLLLTGDIDGLVIINRLQGVELIDSGDTVQLLVSAGEPWHGVVAHAVNEGLGGIENLALIPGSSGAAPVQNIGAYGVEIKDVLTQVQVINRDTGELVWLDASDCGFSYRNSHFKGCWAKKYFITAIKLALSREHKLTLDYGGLAKLLPDQPSIKNVFDKVCQVRTEKLPDPKVIGNAGSFFKNPIVDTACYHKILVEYPDLVAFSVGDSWKLAAGWLIDKAGWKGFQRDGVGVYEKQALCLVNHEAHEAVHLLKLEKDLKQDVYSKYGVQLEREPVQLGNLPLI